MDTALLDADQRQVFAGVADALIPAADPMPSATAVGVPERLIDLALVYRPDLVEPFLAAVAACAGQDPVVALDALAVASPGQFEALTLLTTGAYFQSPLVKAALAYDPAPRTVHDDVDTYVDLLADVVERGFTIR